MTKDRRAWAVGVCLVTTLQAHGTLPDENDLRILQVCEGILRTFEESPSAVWPGYNLATRPLVVYRVNRWALLLGGNGSDERFGPYPSDWPDLHHSVRFHVGSLKDLAGQLVFDYPVGKSKGVAIGVPDPDDAGRATGVQRLGYESGVFGYIVHEAFHQYQDEAFGEIPWGNEEGYPILDLQNSAMAALEMQVLMDAVRFAQHDDRSGCEAATRWFLAVRRQRWNHADQTVRVLERGLELKEGTAQYVEARALDLAAHARYAARVLADQPLATKLTGVTEASLLLADFERRLTDGVVSPDDMPRNRVYPVGGAQCFLLDYLGVDWKPAARRAGVEFAYAKLLSSGLKQMDADPERILALAKEHYDYGKIVARTKKQLRAYRIDFDAALAAFEAQPGRRVEITLSTNALNRSRVSTARKWQVEGGTRCFCSDYKVYVLTQEGVRVQAESCGVLERNDWKAHVRTATVFARGEPRIRIDGVPLELDQNRLYRFQKVDLQAENISLVSSRPGLVQQSGNRLHIDLRPSTMSDR